MTDSTDNYIVFSVAGTSYALRSADVQHVEMVEQVTRVPNAAPFVDGVVFSRGQVVPAVNLRCRFGFERVPYDLRTRLIVVQAAARQVGLIVDESREFVRLPESAIQPPQESVSGLSGRYIQGIASFNDRLILVLQLDQLMNFAEPLIAA
ncbi:MAG TPA: chemotaxis protein CheW [Vicinamibacterales bacterium]|jgi:purine-binding chemotaxis protein CheW